MSDNKDGFFARKAKGTAKYVGRRFGNQFSNKVGRDSLKLSAERARATMIPTEIDPKDFRAGLEGRYEDGGISRFSQAMRDAGIPEAYLPILARQRRRASIIMFAAAAGFLLFGASMIIRADGFNDGLFGFATAFMSLLFMAIGINHDFSRWQIHHRRFGGFKEYLGTKPDRRTSKSTDITLSK